MSKKLKTVINSIVFCTWLALISILLYKTYFGTTLEKTHVLQKSFAQNTYWYDIYTGTVKMGFAITTVKKAGDEIIIENKQEMNIDERLFIEKIKSLCDSHYSIKSFEHTSNFKDEKGYRIKGEVDENEIVFILESPEKSKTYNISTDGRGFYLLITLIPAIHHTMKIPAPGTPFVIPMLDSVNLTIDNVKAVLEEIRPVKVGVNIENLYKFRIGNAIIWSNENGIIIKKELPAGITLYSQLKNIAMSPDIRILFDYTALPFFKSNKLIPDTEILNLFRLKLKGFKPDPQLYKNSLVKLENNILTISKQDIQQLKEKTYTFPYNKDDLNNFINPDEWILSDYKPLYDTGNVYARAQGYDAFKFTEYLNGYIYNLIKTSPAFTLSDSRDILKSLSGDYMEKSIMFASYARAGGLPTRLIGGLVYKNGYFYFHIWPEVWFDKWVPADPTLLQFPADATHIPLKQGTLKDIISIIDDLKNVKIEVLEAS